MRHLFSFLFFSFFLFFEGGGTGIAPNFRGVKYYTHELKNAFFPSLRTTPGNTNDRAIGCDNEERQASILDENGMFQHTDDTRS